MRRRLILCALLSTLALATSNSVLAAGPAPTRVSNGDPFAACLGGGNSFGAVNYQSAEVEPWITSNPTNTSNLIGSWQQDRWSDGGAKGQVASWTFDGGKTWGQTPQPFTTCAQPFYNSPVLQYQRTSDPWVSFGPDGTAYAVSLPFDGDFIRNGLGAAASQDGGRTWIRQQDIDPLVARPDTLNPSDDKQSVTADPLHPGWAYAVWEHFQDLFVCTSAPSRAAVRSGHDNVHRNTRAASPAPTPCGLNAPTFLSRTTNFGRTWSEPKMIVPTGVNEQTIDNQILVNRQTGTLYDFYDYISANGENNIEMVFSNNRGATWSPRQHVQRLATNEETSPCACGVTYPGDPSKPLRTGDIVPSFAIDPNTGQLYTLWQDGRANPDANAHNDMLYASTSTGGGLPGTWSTPIRVNPPGDRAAFTGAINVNSKGQVGIAYYDFTPRLSPNTDILLTDTWIAMTDGPGLEFGPRRLIGGPYNMEAAPVARGFFVGDYIGLATALGTDKGGGGQGGRNSGQSESAGFSPLFVMSNCADTSCTAVGTPDGTPAGPDSTDVFATST